MVANCNKLNRKFTYLDSVNLRVRFKTGRHYAAVCSRTEITVSTGTASRTRDRGAKEFPSRVPAFLNGNASIPLLQGGGFW